MSNNTIQPDDRQEKAWHMRYTLGWTLEHIGRRLGIGKPAVSRLLDRARLDHGQHPRPRHGITRRRVKPISLSIFSNL
jgi:hypothetical protein